MKSYITFNFKELKEKYPLLTGFWTFLVKRFEPLFMISVLIGFVLSAKSQNIQQPTFLLLLLAFIYLFLSFFFLRVKNDLDDIEVDRIAYPQRPFSNGSMTPSIGRQLYSLCLIALIVTQSAILIHNWMAGTIGFLSLGIFLIADQKKEQINIRFKKNLIVKKAISTIPHFLFILVVILFLIPENPILSKALPLCLMFFFSFTVYRLSKKLNPYSHPAALSIIHYYGYRPAFWMAVTLLVATGICSFTLRVYPWTWPAECIVLVFFAWLFYNPLSFKKAEIAARVSLLLHAWILQIA